MFRHLSRQAARQGVSSYRLYDHDLPEFPFIIEIFGDKLSVSEYRRRHGMTEEEHEEWLAGAKAVMAEILAVSPDHIFFRMRQRKPGRTGQYRKIEEEKQELQQIVQRLGTEQRRAEILVTEQKTVDGVLHTTLVPS